jgi:starch synthase
MKVVQTVHGKFHHFDLARQLHRHGMLEAIFTGYPRWKLKDEHLPPDKIKTFPWIRTFLMAKWRYGFINPSLDRELNWLAGETLDAHVASRLPECDVFVGISGSGLKTSRAVKRHGGGYICDRGSAHILHVESLLSEEFKRWGQEFPGIDPRAVAKEENEYAAADFITVPSSFCVRSFVQMGVPEGKIRKVPYGVDLRSFEKVADPSPDRFEALFVGAVSFQKGVPYLLAAFERFKHPRKRLRVVGAITNEMKIFLRDKSLKDVEFLGPIPQSKLVPIMSASHVLLLPSIQDGFGLVLGQSMACGCPVICSTNTGGADLIENGQEGFVVPIRDPQSITARLEELAQDPSLRDRMGEAARCRVKQIGGWNDYGDNYANLCRELSGRVQTATAPEMCMAEIPS